MEKEKATIFDYARMCKSYDDCKKCPIGTRNNSAGIACDYLIRTHTDKANKIILKWCEEQPVKTRQDKFLEMFPNAECLNICPRCIDNIIAKSDCAAVHCEECKKRYWLAEVEENDI